VHVTQPDDPPADRRLLHAVHLRVGDGDHGSTASREDVDTVVTPSAALAGGAEPASHVALVPGQHREGKRGIDLHRGAKASTAQEFRLGAEDHVTVAARTVPEGALATVRRLEEAQRLRGAV
jgi:hypothetical protein